MSVKAIFCECVEAFWIEIAENLALNNNWEPCYWTGSINEDLVKEKFKDIIFHNFFDAIRGIPPKEFLDLPYAVIDEPILKSMAFHESIVLKMMDRMDPSNIFSYHERVRLYHRHLGYWLSVLDSIKPQVVVFHTTPHVVFNYVLYAICKIKNIKTLMLQFTTMNGLVFLVDRIEENLTLKEYYQSLLDSGMDQISISQGARDHLSRIRGDYKDHLGSMPADTKDKHSLFSINEDNKSNQIVIISHRLIRQIRKVRQMISLLMGFRKQSKPNYLKLYNKNIEESHWTEFQYRNYKRKATQYKIKLQKYYDSLTETPELDKPYIYVALHYQPELSTSPLGGGFVHQNLLIEMISKLIPLDWCVYVKENWFQNDSISHGERSRSQLFYDDLKAIPKVKFVPLDTPQWDLIDNAKGVATVTGTTGWESIVRGTPVLLFGNIWFQACEGAFIVRGKGQCKQAIDAIKAGYMVDYNKVQLFVQAMEKTGIKAYGDGKFAKYTGVSYSENISVITKAFQKYANNCSI